MEEFLHLPWDIPEAKDVNSCFINDTALKTYSSTYKILHDKLQQIFSDDSLSENDDPENQGKTRNAGNDILQGRIQVRSKVEICKKQNKHRQYIPCFSDEAKLNYPKKSSLNAERQALYLQLMIKYAKKCSFPTQVKEKELQQYELLHDKVVAERFEFAHFVKQRCALTQDRYCLINPDVKKYIEQVWHHRLSRVSKYPAHYEPLRMLSLVYADSKRPVVMKLKENIFEMGSSPVIFLPKFNTPAYVLTDYSKMRTRFPPEVDIARNAHKVPVSQDKLAESFAVANAVHVVISSSGLKHIVDNHPPNYEKTWDLPVIVKEYRQCDKILRVVYVDKALPPRCLTSMEKNLWYHKFGVKLLVCHRRHQECSESGRNASSLRDSKISNSNDGCEIEAVDDTGQKLDSIAVEINEEDVESENCINAPIKREYSSNEWESDVSTDENRLVIDCSDTDGRSHEKCTPIRNGRKSISQKLSDNNNGENSRITRSKARLVANTLYVNQSVSEKPTQFVASEGYEMDSMSSCKDAPEAINGSGLGESLEDVTGPSSFDATENTLNSEESDSAAVPKEDGTRSYGVNITIGNKQDFSSQELSEEEQTKMENVEFNLSNPDINVTYRLWKLCKEERHLEDRKEGFLKGECPNREINVLVRCKVDGHKMKTMSPSPLQSVKESLLWIYQFISVRCLQLLGAETDICLSSIHHVTLQ